MENFKSSVSLNLSDQANIYRSQKSHLYQYNIFAIFGLGFLEGDKKEETGIAVSLGIDKSGTLTVNGLNGALVDDENILIYTDKKVTESEDSVNVGKDENNDFEK